MRNGGGMEFYMKYSTQMEAARNGEITGEMKLVAEKEGISPESLRSLVVEGRPSFLATKITDVFLRTALEPLSGQKLT